MFQWSNKRELKTSLSSGLKEFMKRLQNPQKQPRLKKALVPFIEYQILFHINLHLHQQVVINKVTEIRHVTDLNI